MFLRHSKFAPSGGAFDGAASSDDVFEAVGKPLVALSLSGGRSTLLMYGATAWEPTAMPLSTRTVMTWRPDDVAP